MAALPRKVVMASGNAGKLREIRRLLAGLGIEVIAQSELGISDADETGTSFVANARIKARHAASASGLPAISDDSGLCVAALEGAPGVYSARYAGSNATDEANIDKLLTALAGTAPSERQAAFHCVACYVSADGQEELLAEGQWPGLILEARRGDGGFGYDPVFFDPESGLSAAELGAEEKNARSHRGKALRQLQALLHERFA